MVGNNETLEQLRALLAHRDLTGQIVLHCRRGRIEDLEVRERLEPPWKAREREAAARQDERRRQA